MNQVTKNPGCQRECHLDRSAGFVVEPGCPIHDRAGFQTLRVCWMGQHPCLVGSLTINWTSVDGTHEHIHAFAFMLGLS